MGNRNRFLTRITLMVIIVVLLSGQARNARIFGNVKNMKG